MKSSLANFSGWIEEPTASYTSISFSLPNFERESNLFV